MKLEQKKIDLKDTRAKLIMIMVFVGFELLAIRKLIDFFQGEKSMLFFSIIYALFPILYYILFKAVTINNSDRKQIKEIGKKVKGEIVDIKKLKRYRSYEFSQCLVIVFENRTTMVYDILENDAFSILKMLLDEYPFQTINTVPVDVYTYRNKVYVDLESVDLSKVDGYDEAVKLLKDMKDDMTM